MRLPWRIAGLGLTLALLAWAFHGVQGGRAWTLAASAAPFLPAFLIPSALATTLDVLAWRRLFRSLGHQPNFVALARVRVAADALMLGLPFGSAISEGATPRLLGRLCGIPVPDALAALAARRCLIVVTHGIYLALGTAALVVALRSRGHPAGPMPWVLAAAAAVLVLLAVALIVVLRRGQAAQALHRLIHGLPLERFRPWLIRHAASFRQTDDQLSRALRAGSWPVWMLLLCWLCEALEAVVFLGALGAGLRWIDVVPIESGLSIVRALAVFAPAGLGAQDLTYARTLSQVGVADALTVAAAFSLLRRSKEACWIGIGLLASPGMPPAPPR